MNTLSVDANAKRSSDRWPSRARSRDGAASDGPASSTATPSRAPYRASSPLREASSRWRAAVETPAGEGRDVDVDVDVVELDGAAVSRGSDAVGPDPAVHPASRRATAAVEVATAASRGGRRAMRPLNHP
ncbi:hypothetical protein GCM10022256_27560 [Frondihabitans peucedani]|uniref:Uncharacterized protein n=1 Tax=Frondihabitans peucedani TaxID=598626 RepID=A0ABP8E4W8_9MICO